MASSLIENLLGEDLETRMPYLLAQFPEHTEDSIRDLAQYDPSGQAKFITWILRVLRQQGGGLTPEAGQQVRSALERFNRVKNYPMFQGKKDINQYTDFEDLFATMAEAEQVMSKAEQVKKGMERVAQWKDYTLWRVNNAAAAKKFAQNSSLCFCDEPHATNYTVAQQGQPRTGPPLFGVTKGNDKVAALHPNSNQYHDMQNRPVSGELRRAVLRLAKLSGDPKLSAWYAGEYEKAIQQVNMARQQRYRERRQRALKNFNRQGIATLGELEGYRLLSVKRSAPMALPLVPEKEREDFNPVLMLTDAEGNVVAFIDAAMGRAVDPQGNQLAGDLAALAGRAFKDYIPEVISPFMRDFMQNPDRYEERFQQRLDEIHRSFVRDRERGWTSPRTGKRYPPITAEEAEQRWEVALPKFEEELRKGWPGLPLRLPGIGMMRVLGHQD